MLNNEVRVRRVSGRQLDILWEYLNSHREIAVAYNRTMQAKEHSRHKWMEVAALLNAEGEGAYKDWKGWSKYWVDYKAKLKRRVAALRSSQSRTGGGPSTEQPLIEIESKFLQILGDNYGQGLPGIRVELFPEPNAPVIQEVEEHSPNILSTSPTDMLVDALDPVVRTPSPSPQPALAVTAPSSHPNPIPSPQSSPPAAEHSPRHRRHRGQARMSQEEGRRALVQASQERAAAATLSARALETLSEEVRLMRLSIQRIEGWVTQDKVKTGSSILSAERKSNRN